MLLLLLTRHFNAFRLPLTGSSLLVASLGLAGAGAYTAQWHSVSCGEETRWLRAVAQRLVHGPMRDLLTASKANEPSKEQGITVRIVQRTCELAYPVEIVVPSSSTSCRLPGFVDDVGNGRR